MKFSKEDIISYIAIFVIVVSLSSIGMQLTGYAAVSSEQAIVNVTVSTSAAINFTTSLVEFGSGSVNNGTAGSILETGESPIGGTWTETPPALILQNIGNVDITLSLEADSAAAAYLGGTTPTFEYKISNSSSNDGSCNGNSASAYTAFTTGPVVVCSPIYANDSKDEIDIDIKLYIPSDSNVGTQTATITATGTYGE